MYLELNSEDTHITTSNYLQNQQNQRTVSLTFYVIKFQNKALRVYTNSYVHMGEILYWNVHATSPLCKTAYCIVLFNHLCLHFHRDASIDIIYRIQYTHFRFLPIRSAHKGQINFTKLRTGREQMRCMYWKCGILFSRELVYLWLVVSNFSTAFITDCMHTHTFILISSNSYIPFHSFIILIHILHYEMQEQATLPFMHLCAMCKVKCEHTSNELTKRSKSKSVHNSIITIAQISTTRTIFSENFLLLLLKLHLKWITPEWNGENTKNQMNYQTFSISPWNTCVSFEYVRISVRAWTRLRSCVCLYTSFVQWPKHECIITFVIIITKLNDCLLHSLSCYNHQTTSQRNAFTCTPCYV